MSSRRDHERYPFKQFGAFGESADDRSGSSGEADSSSGVVLVRDSTDFGGIAFRLAADGCDGLEVAGLFVHEANLGPSDPIDRAHPIDEVLSVAARREQRQWAATPASDSAH